MTANESVPSQEETVHVPPAPDATGEILTRLSRIEAAIARLVPAPKSQDSFPTVEATFALDAMVPHNAARWLSREAIALFPKLVRGVIETSRDEDAPLLELEELGLIEMPRSVKGLTGSVIVHRDRLRITDKGWALHRLIRDICERTIYCCLEDLGSFMGFNVPIGENAVTNDNL